MSQANCYESPRESRTDRNLNDVADTELENDLKLAIQILQANLTESDLEKLKQDQLWDLELHLEDLYGRYLEKSPVTASHVSQEIIPTMDQLYSFIISPCTHYQFYLDQQKREVYDRANLEYKKGKISSAMEKMSGQRETIYAKFKFNK